MGEAKRRGTFEQRKADAISAGRIKVKKHKNNLNQEIYSALLMQVLNRRNK